MLTFALISLSLVLIGIVGLQFSYLFYIERIYRERRKHMRALESSCKALEEKLEAADSQIREQSELLKAAYPEMRTDDGVWADVIEEL